MKKNNTNLILIASILLLLILLGVFAYLFSVIENKNKHTSAVMATLENKISEKENISILEKKMVELGDTSKKISGYLVDTSSIDTFVEYLENIGINNGVDLSVKGVDTPKSEKNKILVNIDMKGSFSGIMKVIAVLENSPYNIIVTTSYVNKEILQDTAPVVTANGIPNPIVKKEGAWQASVTFGVLTL